MTRCPNRRCPIVTVCKAHEDNIPAMCYHAEYRAHISDPETRQLLSNPGHPANEELIPDDLENDYPADGWGDPNFWW